MMLEEFVFAHGVVTEFVEDDVGVGYEGVGCDVGGELVEFVEEGGGLGCEGEVEGVDVVKRCFGGGWSGHRWWCIDWFCVVEDWSPGRDVLID